MNRLIFLLWAGLCMPADARGQAAVDLGTAIEDGRVALISARGNGSSSGAAVEGELKNETRATLRLRVNLSMPLYLENSGRGQNMVATQVFLSGGGYFSDGRESFIELSPGSSAPIMFTAFCVDFDRENPSSEERLGVERTPARIEGVVRSLGRYTAANPTADLTAAGQLALWMAQGKTPPEIRSKFSFSASDEALAREILRN